MKKTYMKPELEVVELDNDVILTSGNETSTDSQETKRADEYNVTNEDGSTSTTIVFK